MSDRQPKRDPGDAWPWTLPLAMLNELRPWPSKPAGFSGFSAASPGWHAWIDRIPPRPSRICVVGDVLVTNPGVAASLTMSDPEGVEPGVLRLNLVLVQQPGIWVGLVTLAQVRFERLMPANAPAYRTVEVYLDGHEAVLLDHVQIVD